MSMNIFRLSGDALHVIAICLLLQRLLQFQTAEGISLRSQELFLLVFITRYLDLFSSFYSLYNSLFKVFYLFSTAYMVWAIREQATSGTSFSFCFFRFLRVLILGANETNNDSNGEPTSYDEARDNFPHWRWLVLPSAIFAFAVHLVGNEVSGFDCLELLWTFSICLESVTILPQLSLLQQYREVDTKVADAVFCLGLYRALYIVNWIYRSYTERNYKHHWLVYACGVLQTFLYADFFFSFIGSKIRGEETVCYTSLLLPRFHRPSEDSQQEDDEGGFLLMQDEEEEEGEETREDKTVKTEHSEHETDGSNEAVHVIQIV